jgi:hypothetical protein
MTLMQRVATCGFLVMAVLACKPAPSNDQDESDLMARAQAKKIIYDQRFMAEFEKNFPLAFLGIIGSRLQPEAFMPRDIYDQFVAELKRATLNPSQPSASKDVYHFVKCEQAMQHVETTAAKECQMIAQNKGDTELEFLFLPSDGRRICSSLGPNCNVHQAVRVYSSGNSFQRPALYIAQKPLGQLNLVIMRPNKHHREVLLQIIPGGSFNRDLGLRIGKLLGEKNLDVQNPMHLSNYWRKKMEKIRLNDARQLAFYIVSIPLNIGAVRGGVAVLSAASKASWIARYFAVVDVASGLVGLPWSVVGLLGLKDHIQSVPAGPERSCLQAAILVADASPYIGTFAVAHAPVKMGIGVVTRFGLMVEFAKKNQMDWRKLDPKIMASIARVASDHAGDIVTVASNGGAKGIAAQIKTLASLVSR